jgi:hypothetical protein
MANWEPQTMLDTRFSSPEATATPWAVAQAQLEQAGVYWLTTVRPDGRPHVAPLIAIWRDGVLYFCTGEGEQKAKNLAQNVHCAVTTGCNTMDKGLDVVIEGDTALVTDEATLRALAGAYEAKYGSDWHFDVRDGAFLGPEGNVAHVYAIAPVKGFGFAKGEPFSQTRWRF